jgi:hypothetical protein
MTLEELAAVEQSHTLDQGCWSGIGAGVCRRAAQSRVQ